MQFKILSLLICFILTIFLFLKLGITLQFFLFCVFSYFLVLLSFIDLKYKAVPDYLLLTVLALSFFISDFVFFDSFINACIASGAMVLLNFLVTFYIQNIKSRVLKDESLKTQEALGVGDIPIIASMAVVLGLNSVVYAIFICAIIALIHAIYLKFTKKDTIIPLIPSLAIGFFIEYFIKLENSSKVF